MTKAICVWYDETTGSNPAWIVSADTIELPSGAAQTTSTLHTCDSEDEAMALGRSIASKRGLPLYRNDQDGPATLVEG